MSENSNHTFDGQYGPRFRVPDEAASTAETKLIRIIDGRYNPKFTVPDGGFITVDGRPFRLEYIDETHFRTEGCYFHICQFGGRVIDRGRDVRPYDPAQGANS